METLFVDIVFDECAKKFSDETAIIIEDQSKSFTYNELNNLANELSLVVNMIISSSHDSICLESPMVSIMIDRDIGMIVGILAILKCGGTYVPVDPNFPPDRQSYIFSHSRSHCLIIDTNSYNNALKLGVELPKVILLDSKTGRVASANNDPSAAKLALSRSRSPDDIAYVLYTSGSTGKPQGVMVPHRGVLNIISWFANELKVNQTSRVLGLTTFCFDISVLEMFMPLLSGACLVIARSSTQKDPFRIIEILESLHVTVMQATPTTYEMMLATGWGGDKTIDFLVCF